MTSDFELSLDELRTVARYATEAALDVLPVFEVACPADARPRAAIEAAREFIDGAPRTRLQRVTSMDAHRAAKDAATEPARLAAQAAGDAASAAYLHPIAKAHQVGHILRAAANAARIAEIEAGAARSRVLGRAVGVHRRDALEPCARRAVDELPGRLDGGPG
ncbi:putative immunity protein, partial [Streptomyces sp. col6]|uniref:putative immunity protein n=1 Tax=Streptomyces sp. col6 TaxID=2478958 RepID=UPI00399029E5